MTHGQNLIGDGSSGLTTMVDLWDAKVQGGLNRATQRYDGAARDLATEMNAVLAGASKNIDYEAPIPVGETEDLKEWTVASDVFLQAMGKGLTMEIFHRYHPFFYRGQCGRYGLIKSFWLTPEVPILPEVANAYLREDFKRVETYHVVSLVKAGISAEDFQKLPQRFIYSFFESSRLDEISVLLENGLTLDEFSGFHPSITLDMAIDILKQEIQDGRDSDTPRSRIRKTFLKEGVAGVRAEYENTVGKDREKGVGSQYIDLQIECMVGRGVFPDDIDRNYHERLSVASVFDLAVGDGQFGIKFDSRNLDWKKEKAYVKFGSVESVPAADANALYLAGAGEIGKKDGELNDGDEWRDRVSYGIMRCYRYHVSADILAQMSRDSKKWLGSLTNEGKIILSQDHLEIIQQLEAEGISAQHGRISDALFVYAKTGEKLLSQDALERFDWASFWDSLPVDPNREKSGPEEAADFEAKQRELCARIGITSEMLEGKNPRKLSNYIYRTEKILELTQNKVPVTTIWETLTAFPEAEILEPEVVSLMLITGTQFRKILAETEVILGSIGTAVVREGSFAQVVLDENSVNTGVIAYILKHNGGNVRTLLKRFFGKDV